MAELTLPQHLKRAAGNYPNLGVFYKMENGSLEFQSYSDLLQTSMSMAGGLKSKGMKPGEKAIIATTDNRHTIQVLWACFLSGIIPTILQSPVTFTDHNPAAVKLLNVFRMLKQPKVFISGKGQFTDSIPGDKVIQVSDIPLVPIGPEVSIDYDDLAFIQFSSGSTGEPKGVMLTHRNLDVNINAIIRGLDLQPNDHGGNWMPLYHDMGLIGYHLTPVVCPCNQYHIETIDFIKNPGLWLDMLHDQKITVTGCPNFGQALVIRYLKRKKLAADWDFSHMKALLNGAEPISVKIMDEFLKSMKEYVMPENSMMPVYGMAEATLAISFSPLTTPAIITYFDGEKLDKSSIAVKTGMPGTHRNARPFVSVGKPLDKVEVRIVNETGNVIADSCVGHIQVRGESVSSGYHEQPEHTDAAFDSKWLLTGDMGFIFEDNLYISGRYKDIIFLNGKNYFAHDLEHLACNLDEIAYGKVIMGGITDPRTGKEKVLAFLAGISEAQSPEMLHKLRTLLRKNMGIPLDELILIRSNDIPKTSSGKIQRYQLIQRYLQGEFKERRFR